MSRYTWPSTGRPSPDRQPQRRAFLAARRGPVDPEAHEQALAQRRALEAAAAQQEGVVPTANADLWVPAGPSAVLRGQTDDRLRVAGRVRDLAISPDGKRAYAGAANGGVWYSGDFGASWMPVGAWAATRDRTQVTSPSQTLTCGSLLVTAWGDDSGTGDVVLVGTGELDTESGAVPGGNLGGVGVLSATSPVPAAITDPLANPWMREAKNLRGRGVYRLAADPADATHVVAATSRGLFSRSLPAAEDSDWAAVTVAPFDAPGTTDDKPLIVTDVLWRGTRLWAAVQDRRDGFAASGLWYSDNGVAGPFTQIDLPGLLGWSRLGLAASDADASVLYVLGRGPILWRVDGTTPHTVTGVPPELFGSPGHDQSHYDLAIAADPADAARVLLGGSTVQTDARAWVASLFDCRVTGAAPSYALSYSTPNGGRAADDATFIGTDVHADVHAIRWSRTAAPAGSRDVWIGCDGGVFRSQDDARRGTFIARNTGIAALETGYVASHPANDALMLAGTQDNGVLRRVGDTVWEAVFLGDGGGVAFDPGTPTRYIGQYTQGTWYDQDYTSLPIVKRTPGNVANTSSENDELLAASWYSNPAVRRTAAGVTRLAVGTHRIWYSEDWGATWVTLPGGHDPRAGGAQDIDTDVPFGAHGGRAGDATVIALRWLDDDTLLVLSQGAVYKLTPKDDPPGWDRTVIDRWDRPKCSTPAAADYPSPSAHLPPFGAWSDLAVHDTSRGSFYVATTASTDGHGHDAETLWWFDGDGHWWATGLRDDSTGVPAPAYAVVTHPTDLGVVFVGTSVGVWKGLLDIDDSQDPPQPSWDWSIYSNGLPEATVQDLSTCQVGAAQLLRGALQARGVWEVDLAAPQPPFTFVRVHAFDSRRQPTTSLDNPAPGAAFPWHASPDVRVRPAPHSAAPAPATLPLDRAPLLPFDTFDLWTFQTALHAVDPLCVADGRWSAGFVARLLAKRAELSLSATAVVDRAIWDAVVVAADNAFVEPWSGTPTEADLYELVRELDAPASPMPTGLRAGAAKVDVLVHHRHYAAVPGDQVAVTLLRLAVAPADGDGAALVQSWGHTINDLLAAGAPGGGFALPGGWELADAAHPVLHLDPGTPLDPRMPRAVTFDVDFGGASVGDRFLLVAVVHSTPDPADLLTGNAVRDLVLGDRHVAARGVEIVA